MAITKRGNSYQVIVHHKGQRYPKTFSNRSDAEVWALETKAALVRGESVYESDDKGNNEPKTLRALFELTYRKYWKDNSSAKTSRINSEACLRVLGEHTPPKLVDENKIDDMVFKFEADGVSDSTINRRMSALSKMLTYAYDRGFIKRKPKMERRKEPEGRLRFISEAEEAELLAYYRHTGNEDMADMITVAVDTGMRRGELLKLQSCFCDVDQKLIVLPGYMCKSGKSRSIPMTNRVREIISRRSKGGTSKIMDGWTKDRVRHYWDAGRSHLGLMSDNQFVFHVLRHTFCSRLVQRGVQIQVVSELAGHSSIQMTMRYAKLLPKNLAVAIEVLNR